MRTPLASREGEPATARPSTIAARAASAARIAVRCQNTRRWTRVLRRLRGRTRGYLRRAGKAAKSSLGCGRFLRVLGMWATSLQRDRGLLRHGHSRHGLVSDTRPWDLPSCAEQPLESEELDPAADVEADAGDVRREVGAEKDDRIRDVLRLSGPPHRRALHHPLVHGGIAGNEGPGADHARADRVAGDAVPRALERHALRRT